MCQICILYWMNRISTDIYPVRLTVSYVMDHFVGICIPNNLHSYIYEYLLEYVFQHPNCCIFMATLLEYAFPTMYKVTLRILLEFLWIILLEYAFPTIDTVKVMNLVGIWIPTAHTMVLFMDTCMGICIPTLPTVIFYDYGVGIWIPTAHTMVMFMDTGMGICIPTLHTVIFYEYWVGIWIPTPNLWNFFWILCWNMHSNNTHSYNLTIRWTMHSNISNGCIGWTLVGICIPTIYTVLYFFWIFCWTLNANSTHSIRFGYLLEHDFPHFFKRLSICMDLWLEYEFQPCPCNILCSIVGIWIPLVHTCSILYGRWHPIYGKNITCYLIVRCFTFNSIN